MLAIDPGTSIVNTAISILLKAGTATRVSTTNNNFHTNEKNGGVTLTHWRKSSEERVPGGAGKKIPGGLGESDGQINSGTGGTAGVGWVGYRGSGRKC